jgi:hypothetical protein
VLAMLLPEATWMLDHLHLVNYAEVLGCAKPTWVAAAGITVRPR